MAFFDAQHDLNTLTQTLESHGSLVVACYCAAWCRTCTEYRPGFEALSVRYPDLLFVWVDIEECEALLDDEDIENFPTLLVQSATGNLFFGPLPPHPEQLDRILQSALESGVKSSAITAEGPGPLLQLLRNNE